MIIIDGVTYFTLTEVAKMFVKKPNSISNWRRMGKLKGHRISPRKFIFSEIEIKNFVEGIYDEK
jgi:hypothetical protein